MPAPRPSDPLALSFPLQNPGLVEQYLSAILSLEPNQNYAGMLGLLVQFCTDHKEMDVVSQHKVSARPGGEGSGERLWPQGPSPGLSCGLLVSSPRPGPFAVMHEF